MMKLIVIGTFVLCLGIQVSSKGCSLPLEVSDDKYLPVIEQSSGSSVELVLPDSGNVVLGVGDTIILSCPNSGNKLTLTSNQYEEATCVSDQTITVAGESQDYNSVVCSKTLRGSALTTDTSCANGNGYIIKLGFPSEGDDFLTLIESCYDSTNGNALYTTHLIYGTRIEYSSSTSYRPSFSTAEMADGVSADVSFKQVTQKALFNTLLGSATLAEKYIVTSKSYLARGHLSPDADFLFASWQFATYFYVNVVPQWQPVNNGNWKKLETLSRKAAASFGEDIRVYTGGYKVLTLPDVNDVETEIYLSGDKLAVPKFVWKILYSEVSGKAIAFVSLNNPFLTELASSDQLCTDICDAYGWGGSTWSTGSKGYVYCCEVSEFLSVISNGPEIDVKGILTYES